MNDLTVFVIVNETTTDIICVKCKQDCSDKGNEIVLCDQCGYGMCQLQVYNIILKLGNAIDILAIWYDVNTWISGIIGSNSY